MYYSTVKLTSTYMNKGERWVQILTKEAYQLHAAWPTSSSRGDTEEEESDNHHRHAACGRHFFVTFPCCKISRDKRAKNKLQPEKFVSGKGEGGGAYYSTFWTKLNIEVPST